MIYVLLTILYFQATSNGRLSVPGYEQQLIWLLELLMYSLHLMYSSQLCNTSWRYDIIDANGNSSLGVHFFRWIIFRSHMNFVEAATVTSEKSQISKSILLSSLGLRLWWKDFRDTAKWTVVFMYHGTKKRTLKNVIFAFRCVAMRLVNKNYSDGLKREWRGRWVSNECSFFSKNGVQF